MPKMSRLTIQSKLSGSFRVPDLTSKLLEIQKLSIESATNFLILRKYIQDVGKTAKASSTGKNYPFRPKLMLINCNFRFNQATLIDTAPLPAEIPPVTEIGSSSAPLLSASFFIGARCKPYNDDFMQCKSESAGKGEVECLKEGRRVTRCARSV
jgi:hypothetical protein